MNILVTGCAGLIGTKLTEVLLKQGHYVIGLDNFINSSESDLTVHKNFKFIEHNIRRDYPRITFKIDRVYHLACPASPVHYKKIPKETLLTSVMGTYKMLSLSELIGARFLFTSSSEVYGDATPMEEDQPGVNIQTLSERGCYVEGKRAAEALIWSYKDKLDIRLIRLFNVYGPKMAKDDGRVIPNFILNRPVIIHGNGTQKRSFCYVDDAVDGIIKVMESDVKTPVNIGNPDGCISMNNLAYWIFDLMHEEHDIIRNENDDTGVLHRIPDITKAREIGWSPTTSLEIGLSKTIEGIKQ